MPNISISGASTGPFIALLYNSGTSKSGIGGLSNVLITNAQDNQTLLFNSGANSG